MTMTKEEIQCLGAGALLAIVQGTNPATVRFANELAWAKAELQRRGIEVNDGIEEFTREPWESPDAIY